MNWPTVKLGDICDLQNGFAFKSNDYVEISNVLNCRMSNIRPNGNFDIFYHPKYLPENFVQQYKEYLLKDGDVIIAMTDLAGEPKILGVPTIVDTKGKFLLLNQRVGKLVFKNGVNIKIEYLKHVLSRPEVKKYYRKFAGGGLQINLGKQDLLSISIPLPPIEEQYRIAALLDLAAGIMLKREKVFTKLDQLAQSMFIEMFGDPIHNLKKIPTLKVKELCKLINGRAFKPSEWEDSGMPIIRIQNLNDESKSFNFTTKQFDPKYLVKKDDVLFSWSGTPGTSFGCFKWNRESGWLNQHIFKVELNNKLIKSDFFITQMNLKISELIFQAHGGVGLQHVTKGMVDNLELLIPSIELQLLYAEKLKKVEKLKLSNKLSSTLINQSINSIRNQAFKTGLAL